MSFIAFFLFRSSKISWMEQGTVENNQISNNPYMHRNKLPMVAEKNNEAMLYISNEFVEQKTVVSHFRWIFTSYKY